MIEVDAVHKTFPGGRGLHGFSLQVGKNELVGLVGPNGAGKTTLIKILATLLSASSGKVQIDGRDPAAASRGVRALVGYLPDIAGIYQDMRVREFLEFFADAFQLKGPRRGAAIERALELSGLRDRHDEFVENLSLGWKQRLLLAKTLLHEPRVLLLDEPATGLDPLARIALREQLKRLHAEGVGILISSHILTDLEDICTRIAFIADGKNVTDPAVAAISSGTPKAEIQCELEYRGPRERVKEVADGFVDSHFIEKKEGLAVVALRGGAPEASQFLKAVLNSGIIVVHFDARGPGLEERYRRAFEERKS